MAHSGYDAGASLRLPPEPYKKEKALRSGRKSEKRKKALRSGRKKKKRKDRAVREPENNNK